MADQISHEMAGLTTESRNLEFKELDSQSTIEIISAINSEDKKVAFAVERVIPEITAAVDAASMRFDRGGRVIYVGSGTSGRIAETDASEIAPTFDTEPERFIALQSGVILQSKDGSSEDIEEGAIRALQEIELQETDIVFGIAASGRTPFVIGALRYAKSIGALTISLSSNSKSLLAPHSDISICCEVGPEVIYGSTRMKSGTSQKLILNLFSTTLMVKQGRTFGNLMSHMRVANAKLQNRATRIVMEATGCDMERARASLAEADNKIAIAILLLLSGAPVELCKHEFELTGGRIRTALANLGAK